MIRTAIRQLATTNSAGSRFAVTVLRPAAMAISARYASSSSSLWFSTNAKRRDGKQSEKKAAPLDLTNDLTFAENAWAEKEAQIKAKSSSHDKVNSETFVSDHVFDVNEEPKKKTPEATTTDETGIFLTKPVFDKTFSTEGEPSDHTFDLNEFPEKVVHIKGGAAVKKSEEELFKDDHEFDVNQGTEK